MGQWYHVESHRWSWGKSGPDTPVSPVLACIYTVKPLQNLIENPTSISKGISVGSCSYMDNLGFLVISDSYDDNIQALTTTITQLVDKFSKISMHIDPNKSDIMRFSSGNSPPLKVNLYGTDYSFSPPSKGSIQWLGVFLQKITFKLHVNIMANRGKTILHGINCLGNIIKGANQNTLCQLFHACVLSVLTYASPT